MLTAALAGAAFCAGAQSSEILIADFEGETYGEWKTEGTAFGTAPARGTLPGQQKVEWFKGRGLVNSFLGGDGATGTLTSPPFKIERPFIALLRHRTGRGRTELVGAAGCRCVAGQDSHPAGRQAAWGIEGRFERPAGG